MSLRLQVSLNGARGAVDGAAVPLSPGDLVESALGAVAAGAAEVLVHPRTPCGRESLSPRVVGPLLEALRGAGVSVPLSVCASTAAEPDPAGRLERVRLWKVLPDRAAVHFAEPGAAELARELLARGVAVDAVVGAGRCWVPAVPGDRAAGGASGTAGAAVAAGLCGAAGAGAGAGADAHAGAGADAHAGAGGGVGAGTGVGPLARFFATLGPELAGAAQVRPAVELAAVPAAGPAAVAGLVDAVCRPAVGPVLVCGREAAAWPVLRLAVRCGADARIGLGDVLRLPDGRPAGSNAALVAAAHEAAGDAEAAGTGTAGLRGGGCRGGAGSGATAGSP
ncbi:3-keto-5-aminohexanoate cleavage protein [Streptomyces sp. NPDC059851]|uniref:3-keto-5-aminohexanoate cleavage protein n=1 Tax=Streptomyces sp. NPDC059851 TaxID=3346971 RepID=UPI00365B71C3